MSTRKKETKVVFIADLHGGHRAGLTPPKYRWDEDSELEKYAVWGGVQHEGWDKYLDIIDQIGRPDILVANGDLIDGPGMKATGAEYITTDVTEQCEMAAECLLQWRARETHIVRGTFFHVGINNDYEDWVAELVEADTIKNHLFLQVEDVVFDVKHKVGGSSIPHGSGTSVLREKLWNDRWAKREEQPQGDVCIRAHIHRYVAIDEADGMAMVLPSLEVAGTRYGGRECSGTVDWGVVAFYVSGANYRYEKHLVKLESNKQELVIGGGN